MYLHRQARTFAVWSEFLGRLRVHDITIWNMRPETRCCLLFLFTFGPSGRREDRALCQATAASFVVLSGTSTPHILSYLNAMLGGPYTVTIWEENAVRRLDVWLNAAVVFHRHMPGRSATARKEETIRAYVMQYRWDESGIAATLNRHYGAKLKVCPAW